MNCLGLFFFESPEDKGNATEVDTTNAEVIIANATEVASNRRDFLCENSILGLDLGALCAPSDYTCGSLFYPWDDFATDGLLPSKKLTAAAASAAAARLECKGPAIEWEFDPDAMMVDCTAPTELPLAPSPTLLELPEFDDDCASDMEVEM
jgi:hypothetical protein